jgi:DNA-binding NarL/FixJ family response regulator
MRILLVDDHAEVRTMLRVALRQHPNLKVVGEADSAASGLELARRLQPQAIVWDLMLPDAAPWQAFISARKASPSSRMVIYSGKESNRLDYEQQGARFFGKSTDSLDDLLDWIRAEADGIR